MGKKKAVNEMELPKEYDRDFEFFNNILHPHPYALAPAYQTPSLGFARL